MHDGRLATLEDVIDFYSEGGRANPFLDSDIRPVRLDPEEKRALVAFLESLTGSVSEGTRYAPQIRKIGHKRLKRLRNGAGSL
jgi:cytochrome c peroxidase